MSAYIIAEIEVQDPQGYEAYRELASASVAAHGGRFLVRGGAVAALEGGWMPKRLVVIEFPDAGTARRWWSSDGYARARAIRQRTAETRMVIVEGPTA